MADPIDPLALHVIRQTLSNRRHQLDAELERFSPATAMLMRKAAKRYGEGGKDISWDTEVEIDAAIPYTPGDEGDFSEESPYREATVPWAAYWKNQGMFEMHMLQNQGTYAVVNLFEKRQSRIERSLLLAVQDDLLGNDGNLAGQTDRWMGIPSFLGRGAANADNQTVDPDDSYGGLDTDLGTFGGTTQADPSYTAWSPVIVDATGTGFNDGVAATWAAQGDKSARFAIQRTRNRATSGRQVDVMILPEDRYVDLKNLEAPKQRYALSNANTEAMLKLGFDAFTFDNVTCITDVAQPAATIYGLAFNDIRLYSLLPRLFDIRSEKNDQSGLFFLLTDRSFRWGGITYSQVVFRSPRHTFTIVDV